jgi:protein TonB
MRLKKTSNADLQNKKTLFFEIGLGMSLIVVLVAFNWTTKEKTGNLLIAEHQEIVEVLELVPITMEPPSPPEIPKIPQIPDVIDIVDDEVIINMNIDLTESERDIFLGTDYIPKKQEVIDKEEVIEIIPFAIVEKKPLFQGKDADEFVKWINSKLANNYPQAAIDNNLQGTVRISFTVNIDGTLSDIKSLRKVDPILEECVIELVKKSPKWTPGQQQNKPVKVTYQVPVVFRLQ